MTYYQANTESADLVCDSCGEIMWEPHPKYGDNTEARLKERERTGIQWAWTPNYSADFHPCLSCGDRA